MAIAGSAAVTSRFAVTHVLTAGAPVGGMRSRPGIQVLSVEHSTDVVPALDGSKNPDTRDWTTVRRDLSTSDDPAERTARLSLGGSHDVDLYAHTLDLVDARAAEHPSLTAWHESVGSKIFGADGTTAVVTQYTGLANLAPAALSPVTR